MAGNYPALMTAHGRTANKLAYGSDHRIAALHFTA